MNRFFSSGSVNGRFRRSNRQLFQTIVGAGLVLLLGVAVQLSIGIALICFAAWMFPCK
jgi:hypothetical protein